MNIQFEYDEIQILIEALEPVLEGESHTDSDWALFLKAQQKLRSAKQFMIRESREIIEFSMGGDA